MTIFTELYARLVDDSYGKETIGEDAENAEAFGVLRLIDKPSGYHGVIYRNKETQELVVVHRGTEFEGDKIRDLAITDAQMALLTFSHKRRRTRTHFNRYRFAISSTSSSNAAAVTSSPAPGPWINNGWSR